MGNVNGCGFPLASSESALFWHWNGTLPLTTLYWGTPLTVVRGVTGFPSIRENKLMPRLPTYELEARFLQGAAVRPSGCIAKRAGSGDWGRSSAELSQIARDRNRRHWDFR